MTTKKLPHPAAVVEALCWLRAGAPAASRDHNAARAVQTLLDAVEALPALDKRYSFGSDEWKAAMAEPQDPAQLEKAVFTQLEVLTKEQALLVLEAVRKLVEEWTC